MTKLSATRKVNQWVLLIFLLSGMTGLVYEIVWMKLLVLVMGNTVYSTTTVLAAFMGGLGLGSFLAGRFLHRVSLPLKTYGYLEGAIGLYALAVPLLVAAADPLFGVLYRSGAASSLSLVRLIVCGGILLIPTTLMGATLPLLSAYLAERETDLGWTIGKLYGINTLGAVVGAASAGFLLIPNLGLSWTSRGAAFINLAIAGLVLWRFDETPLEAAPAESPAADRSGSKKNKKRKKRKAAKADSPKPIAVWDRRTRTGALIAIALAGAAAMIYQLAWTRVLSLLIGSSVYAFSLIVTGFVAGLALGALAFSKLLDRRHNAPVWLAGLQAATGLFSLFTVTILAGLPLYMTEQMLAKSRSFREMQFLELGLVLLVVLVPTFLMGAAFPLAARISTTTLERFGRSVGDVYALNTLGAITGTLVGGFLLIPTLGTETAIAVAVGINVVAAVLVLLFASNLSLARVAFPLAVIGATFLVWQLTPSWGPRLLASGPHIYAERYQSVATMKNIALESAMKGGEQVFFEEGLHATVSVEKTDPGDFALQVNGKTDASAKGDAATQLSLGHFPMLFHPHADSALVIGLGSGMTLGAVEQYPVRSIDVVELEKRVVEANTFFRPFNHQALDDPRVRLLVTDGRQHLTYTDRRYDVIISEPSNPWVAGMSSLFTREFFEQAKARLLDGGIICQWVHAYSMSSLDFQMILATFQSVFPRMGLFEIGPGGDYILLGFDHDQPIDLDAVRSRFADERFRDDFTTMNVRSAETLLARVLLGPDEAADYVAEAPIHTDDNALLEYSAPRSFFDAGRRPLLEDLYRHRAKPEGIRKLLELRNVDGLEAAYEARSVVLEGFRWTLERDGEKAAESLTRALELDPRDADAVSMLHRLYNQTGKKEDALGRDDVALEAFERAAETIELFVDGDPSQLRHHFSLNVEYSDTLVRLGTLYFERERIEEAKAVLERALEGDADNAEVHNNVGATYEAAGLLEEALFEFERAVEIHPSFASAHMNAANIYLRAGLLDRAIASYREAQRHRPEFEMTYYNLGVAFYQSGSWDQAEIEWARALALKPDFEEAKKALVRLDERRAKGETPPVQRR